MSGLAFRKRHGLALPALDDFVGMCRDPFRKLRLGTCHTLVHADIREEKTALLALLCVVGQTDDKKKFYHNAGYPIFSFFGLPWTKHTVPIPNFAFTACCTLPKGRDGCLKAKESRPF